MGRRRDKGQRIAHYLNANMGKPLFTWDKSGYIDAPWPYSIRLITDRSLSRFMEAIKTAPDDLKLPITIRYDGEIEGVDNAIVAVRLRDFIKLLDKHYEERET